MITIIAAVDNKMGIGMFDGRIPWKQRNDMQRFKALTYHGHVVVGRKTFDTFQNVNGLPGRTHTVLTRTPPLEDQRVPGVNWVPDMQEALKQMYEFDLFVIGGAEVYKQALPFADRLMLTRIHADANCDVFFPEVDLMSVNSEWKKVATEHYKADTLYNQYDYSFETYVRN